MREKRFLVLFGASEWEPLGTGSGATLEYSNANEITFGLPAANWGTITGAALFDDATGGNLFYLAPLASSKEVNLGDRTA